MSGTSMAGPHVVGVVALLWSARPALVRNIAADQGDIAEQRQSGSDRRAANCGGTPSTTNSKQLFWLWTR